MGQIEEALKAMQVAVAEGGLKVRYVPDGEALAGCAAFGRGLAGRIPV